MTDLVKEHLARWAEGNGREELTKALREMSLEALTEEFRNLINDLNVETYSDELVDVYLNVLDEKDPMPPMSLEDSFLRLVKRGVKKGVLTQREAFALWLRYDGD